MPPPINLDGWAWGEVVKIVGMPVAVFLLVMLTARLQLPGLCIFTPVTGTSCSVYFLRSQGCRLPALQLDTHYCCFLCSLLLVLGGYREASCGRVEGRDAARLQDSAFCLEIMDARTQLLHLCILFLFWSLP